MVPSSVIEATTNFRPQLKYLQNPYRELSTSSLLQTTLNKNRAIAPTMGPAFPAARLWKPKTAIEQAANLYAPAADTSSPGVRAPRNPQNPWPCRTGAPRRDALDFGKGEWDFVHVIGIEENQHVAADDRFAVVVDIDVARP